MSKLITKNDLTNIFNEVLPTTSVNYVVETHIEPLTIATNGYVETTFTATKSGYFPLGIVGYRIGWVSGETGKCNIYSLKMTNKSGGSVTVAYAVYNVTSASVSMNLQVDILWAKVDGTSVSLQADYVVEEGTDGIWTYRKWNSGIAECWGRHSWTITAWASWGGVVESNSSYATYPSSLFVSEPTLNVQNLPCSDSGATLSVELNQDASASRTPTMYLIRGIGGAVNVTGYVDIHAIGTWK